MKDDRHDIFLLSGFGGAWGMIAVGLFAEEDKLEGFSKYAGQLKQKPFKSIRSGVLKFFFTFQACSTGAVSTCSASRPWLASVSPFGPPLSPTYSSRSVCMTICPSCYYGEFKQICIAHCDRSFVPGDLLYFKKHRLIIY